MTLVEGESKGPAPGEPRRGADPAPGETEREAVARPAGWAPGRAVSPTELERVIRRASDLQFRSGASDAGLLDEEELLRIGEEVGLDPRYVRQALAEVHADSLVPALPEESALAAKLWGSGVVRASRVVPGGAVEVEAELEAYLREREVLTRVRSRPGRSLWEPAGGLWSTMRRTLDVGGHGYELAKARNLEVRVETLEPGFTLVTLTADLRNERKSIAAGWYAGLTMAAGPVAIALLAAVGVDALTVLGAGALATSALGGATAATERHFRRRAERMELILQGVLDRLEQGERLVPTRPSWKDRLLDATRA